jgi:hypothetical protein
MDSLDKQLKLRYIWLRIRTSGRFFLIGYETSGSIKCEILEELSMWQVLKKDSAPLS